MKKVYKKCSKCKYYPTFWWTRVGLGAFGLCKYRLLCFLPSDPKSYLLTDPNDLLDVLINMKILVECDYSCQTAGPPANNNDSFYIQRNRKICIFPSGFLRATGQNQENLQNICCYVFIVCLIVALKGDIKYFFLSSENLGYLAEPADH